eukprot:1887134-Rhodomonas_salina.2
MACSETVYRLKNFELTLRIFQGSLAVRHISASGLSVNWSSSTASEKCMVNLHSPFSGVMACACTHIKCP